MTRTQTDALSGKGKGSKMRHNLPQHLTGEPCLTSEQVRYAAIRFGQSDYTQSLLSPVTPDELLWLSVIHQAVLDGELPARRNGNGTRCMCCNGKKADHRSEALKWFASEAGGVGSLLWICEKLRLDPVEVRRLLKLGRVVSRSVKRTGAMLPARRARRAIASMNSQRRGAQRGFATGKGT